MRNLARLGVGALVGALVLAAAGCGGDNGGGTGGATATTSAPTTTAAAASGGEEIKLTAKGIKWDTTSLDLKSGTSYTVEVTNGDSVEHNFTFQEAGANQDIEGGEDAKATFTAPAAGSYEFFCKYHPSAMRGTVTVT
ncbi:MAG TPA: cupredoxin domain-containing protein [Actinomycetota bacterium]|nr:cupredoxin domain-containing protein [Actinomycetota bacterium]